MQYHAISLSPERIHHDNRVRHLKILPTRAHHHDGADSTALPQGVHLYVMVGMLWLVRYGLVRYVWYGMLDWRVRLEGLD